MSLTKNEQFGQQSAMDVARKLLSVSSANGTIEYYKKLFKLPPLGPHILEKYPEYSESFYHTYGFQQKAMRALREIQNGTTPTYTESDLLSDLQGTRGIEIHIINDPLFFKKEIDCTAFCQPVSFPRKAVLFLPSVNLLAQQYNVPHADALKIFYWVVAHEGGHGADWLYDLKKYSKYEYAVLSEARQQYVTMLCAFASGYTDIAEEQLKVVKWFLGDTTKKDLPIEQPAANMLRHHSASR
ncbi:MAG TPA: hypothetical protein VJ246_02570 [Patescibacteria group bacterium]|nr:hypothetical protein [Patescibacteria group bacterium]